MTKRIIGLVLFLIFCPIVIGIVTTAPVDLNDFLQRIMIVVGAAFLAGGGLYWFLNSFKAFRDIWYTPA